GHLARLSTGEFANALRKGAAYARDALAQPREGTILTVLREFSLAAEAQVPLSSGFPSLFANSLSRVREALEATRGQLEELRAANVVDAGALGFVEVLEGMRRFLETGELGKVVTLRDRRQSGGQRQQAQSEDSRPRRRSGTGLPYCRKLWCRQRSESGRHAHAAKCCTSSKDATYGGRHGLGSRHSRGVRRATWYTRGPGAHSLR
ncbi:MAG: DAK2 domain-containing protein, partial [Gammaproteobacteria bacterium]|nr:DAK2 domain-containing protein [Gammaproteobacteria bacterium]